MDHRLFQRRHQRPTLSCYKEGQTERSLPNIHKRRNMVISPWSFYHPMCKSHESDTKPCPYRRIQGTVPPPRTSCVPMWRGGPQNASSHLDRLSQIHKRPCHTASPVLRWSHQISYIQPHCIRFHTTQRTSMNPKVHQRQCKLQLPHRRHQQTRTGPHLLASEYALATLLINSSLPLPPFSLSASLVSSLHIYRARTL